MIEAGQGRRPGQYGVTGIAGNQPGYPNNPDGIDLAPPHSLLDTVTASPRTN